ncbi:hypothetical protein [Hyphomonas atlantica corrig.]|uniref:hypothetical protein n=1 Tax=Hyphomonas atlantica TaxID=1280948 RepID=UPI0023550407|nr:hypothetical protein [Hyphomonas atlantica]
MTHQSQIHTTCWNGIDIEIEYYPTRFGGAISHVGVKSINPDGQPLPITSTGYRSHFVPIGTIEANDGDVVAQVLAWLDETAQSPEWQAHLADAEQGDLFL